MQTFRTINPATGEQIQTYPEMPWAETEACIKKTHAAYLHWKKTSFNHRSDILKAVANVLRTQKRALAELMADEMGKPVSNGQAEIEKCAWVCEHYAEHAEEYLKPQIIHTEQRKSFVSFHPTGVLFAIMPWNFPFWQVFRMAAPNLMAGQGFLLKHAEISTGSGLAIEKVFEEAGLPEDLFQTLIISNEQAADVIAHPLVAGVSITGSVRAGRSVAENAGRALKKVVLELGGSDPYLILEDADLEHAVITCASARLHNTGQVCIAPKRIIAVASVYDRLIPLFEEEIKKYVVGNPLLEKTQLGPMARGDLRQEVDVQVKASIQKGARCLIGGDISEGPGFYYPPTLLVDVKPGMAAFDDEIFGPVVALIRAKDEKQAIEMANQSEFGLGAAVFTTDLKRGEHIADQLLEAGCCAVNTFVRSDPRVPFGGIKHSGIGRELGTEGIRSFMNMKTVFIA